MDRTSSLRLAAYLQRIGLERRPRSDRGGLARLHRAHLGSIPFENVDVLLGRPISLDLASLQAKLVERRRGGYCFEQNTLFAAVLRKLGFEVATLEARVRPPGAARVLPRTHMALRVELPDGPLLADVGFGGDGPVEPVPLDGATVRQDGDGFRVVAEPGGASVLQLERGGAWRDLYAVATEPALPVDFEVANHYTSTFPGSPFTRTLTVQRTLPGERRILRHRTYTERRDGVEQARDIADDEVLPLLADRFGVELDQGTLVPSAPPTPR